MQPDELATTTARATAAPLARVTYVGHATVLLDLPGARILTDPLLGPRVGPLRVVPRDLEVGAVDAVLLSHAHRDHLDAPSLRRLGADVRLIGPAAVARAAAARGVRRPVEVVAAGDEVDVGGRTVRVTEAVHGAPGSAVGFLVDDVYFAGDTALYPGMAELAGAVVLALLPVAGWSPRLGPGHLDPAGAVEALRLLRARVAVPIHWGTVHPPGFGRLRYLRDPPHEFARLAAAALPEVEVCVLPAGGVLEVPR